MQKKIERINESIINRIVTLTAILLFPALILSLARSFTTGWLNVYLIHIFVYISALLTAVYRKKIKTTSKIVIISLIYIVIAYTGLIALSLGGAFFYVILTIALLTILTKRKITLVITGMFLIIYSIVAYGFISGFLTPKVDLNVLSRMPEHWMAHFMSLFSLSVIFIYGFGDFYKELLKTLENEESIELKYRLLFEKANDAITLLKDGVFFDCNDKACKFFMYNKDELIGKSIKEVSPEYQYDGQKSDKKAYLLVQKALQGSPQQFEWQHQKSNGEIIEVLVSLNRVEHGGEFYTQGILRDITRRKRNERKIEAYKNELEKAIEKLKVSEAGYKKFIEYNPIGIMKVGFKEPIPLDIPEEDQFEWFLSSAYIADCNDEYAKAYGFKGTSDIIGKSTSIFWNDKALERQIVLETIKSDFSWKFVETEEITPVGKKLFMLNSLFSTERDSKIYSFWVIAIDITEKKKIDIELENHRSHLEKLVKQRTLDLEAATEEWKSTSEALAEKNKVIDKQNAELQNTLKYLKETQAQLLEAEKMASLGTLTAGVSHEINNPLQYLSGTYYGLANYFNKYGSHEEQTTNLLLSSTETAIKRISSIVKGLNQFSRDNSSYDEDCDIHSIIDNCLTVLFNQYKSKVEIIKDFCSQVSTIKGNVGKLHQVFTNILGNSIQSIENKGQISITTHCTDVNIVIEISDTGCGISKENLMKITDPFFTTKPPGKGTGLGLSITNSIIKEHKGILKFESEIGKGTKAIINFPFKTK